MCLYLSYPYLVFSLCFFLLNHLFSSIFLFFGLYCKLMFNAFANDVGGIDETITILMFELFVSVSDCSLVFVLVFHTLVVD